MCHATVSQKFFFSVYFECIWFLLSPLKRYEVFSSFVIDGNKEFKFTLEKAKTISVNLAN